MNNTWNISEDNKRKNEKVGRNNKIPEEIE
jgi:hypothetical protein